MVRDSAEVVIDLERQQHADESFLPHEFDLPMVTYRRRKANETSRVDVSIPNPYHHAGFRILSRLRRRLSHETANEAGVKLREGLGNSWDAEELSISAVLKQDSDEASQDRPLGAPRLFMTMKLKAQELLEWPWELLRLRDVSAHLGAYPTVLFRYEMAGTETTPPRAEVRTKPTRILVACSNASAPDRPGTDFDRSAHAQWVEEAAARSEQFRFSRDADVIERASLDSIIERLRAAKAQGKPISVLHLACSGQWRRDEGYVLYLHDEQDKSRAVPIDIGTLQSRLSPFKDMVRLIFLCADESSGLSSERTSPQSAACTLHGAGFQSVIGFRYLIDEATSRIMTRAFYDALLQHLCSLETAVLRARKQLVEMAPSTFGYKWLGLQLFTRSADGNDTRPLTFRPYPGLRPFHESEGAFYFGREAHVKRATELLVRFAEEGKPRLLVISGSSGVGKSSLARAGIGRENKRIGGQALFVRPGEGRELKLRPFEFLQKQLGSWLARPLERERRRLLVIDQLEELIAAEYEDVPSTALHAKTRAGAVAPSAAEVFLSEVYRLACAAEPIDVVLTVRSDFLGRFSDLCLDRQTRVTFGKFLSGDHYVFLDKPELADLRRIIEGPAEQVGLRLEPGLVDTLLAESEERRGILLPLLGYALDYLWERRDDRGCLTHDVYNRELQKLSGVITKQAHRVEEELLRDKSQDERARHMQQLQRLLVKLVNLHEDTAQVTRRLVRTAEIQPKEQADLLAFESALSVLAKHRLIEIAGRSEQTVELVHETLIEDWETAQTAIQTRREQELKLRRLHRDYERAVERSKESPEHERAVERSKESLELLQGLHLSEAQELLLQADAEIPEELRQYIRTSIEEQQRQEREVERRKQELRDRASFGQSVIELYNRPRGVGRQTRAALFLRKVENLSEQQRWQAITQDTLRGPILFGTMEQHSAALDRSQEYLLICKGNPLRTETLRANIEAHGIELTDEMEERLQAGLPQNFPVVLCNLYSGAPEAALLFPLLPERMACSLSDGLIAGASDAAGICVLHTKVGEFRILPAFSRVHRMYITSEGGQVTALLDAAALTIKGLFPLYLTLSPLPQDTLARHINVAPTLLWAEKEGLAQRLSVHSPEREAQNRREEPIVVFDKTGRRFAALLGDNQVGLFALPSGEGSLQKLDQGIATELKPVPAALIVTLPHTERVGDIQFSPDDRQILTSSQDGLVRIWDAQTGTLLRTLPGSPEPSGEQPSDEKRAQGPKVDIRAIAWSASGARIATVSLASEGQPADRNTPVLSLFDLGAEGTVTPARVELRRSGTQYPAHDMKLLFGSYDRLLFAYEPTGIIWIVQTADCSVLAQIPPHSLGGLSMYSMDPGFTVQFSDPTSTLLTWGTRQPLRLYRIHSFLPIAAVFHPDVPIKGDHEMRIVAKEPMNQVRSVCFTPDGRGLITGSSDGTAREWRIGSQHARQIFQAHGTVCRVALGRQEEHVLGAVLQRSKEEPAGAVSIWNRQTGDLVETLSVPEGARSAQIDSQGRFLLVASDNKKEGWVRLFELSTKERLLEIPHPSVVSEAVFDATGEYFLSACDDGIARLFCVNHPEPVMQFPHSPGHDVNSVCFVPEEDGLLTASKDGSVVLWSRSSGERRREFRLRKPTLIYHIAYRSFGATAFLVTADEAGDVCIWNTETTNLVGCIHHGARVVHTAFDASGELLATACDDGGGRVFRWREHTDGYLLAAIKTATELSGLPEEESDTSSADDAPRG